MRFLFDCCYLCLSLLALPILLYRWIRYGKYQQGWPQKLFGNLPIVNESGGVWFHAVSVGEVNVLVPLIRALRQHWPHRPFMISTTSQTGFDLAKQRFPTDLVAYAPLDFSWAVRRAFDRWQPHLLVLVELEVWPNLINEAHRRSIKTAIINGRLSERSFAGYRRLQWWFRPVVTKLSLVAAQNQVYADRFCRLGVPFDRVTVTGSTKFDQAKTDRNSAACLQLRKLVNFDSDAIIFIAGSTQAPEEEYALQAFLRLRGEFPHLRLLLVPRHRERFDEVADLLQRTKCSWLRRSERVSATRDLSETNCFEVLLVDTIGELADWWGLADVAFVGGSFGSRGGQNMLEPAAFGVPTCFGPHTENFRDISQSLLDHQAAEVVTSINELYQFVRKVLADTPFRMTMGRRGQDFVLAHQGGITKTCDQLLALDKLTRLPSSRGPRRRALSAENARTAAKLR